MTVVARHLFAVSIGILCACPLLAQVRNADDEELKTEKEIDLVWDVKVPMRDTVHLNATVYKPKQMDAPLPVLFTLTPYISDNYHDSEHPSFLEIPIVLK